MLKPPKDSAEISSAELLESCSKLVARAETRFNEGSLATGLPQLIRDLLAALPGLDGVAFLVRLEHEVCLENDVGCENEWLPLATGGSVSMQDRVDDADTESFRSITPELRTAIRLWISDRRLLEAGPGRIVAEMLHSIVDLFAAAVARTKLQHDRELQLATDDVLAVLAAASVPDGAFRTSQLFHGLAKVVARAGSFDRVLLFRQTDTGYRFAASNLHPDVDRGSRLIKSAEQFANRLETSGQADPGRSQTVPAELLLDSDYAPHLLSRIDPNSPPQHQPGDKQAARRHPCLRVHRWADGAMLTIGERQDDRVCWPPSGVGCGPALRSLFDLAAARTHQDDTHGRWGVFLRRPRWYRLGIAAAVIALLCLLPIPFHIKVDGRLIPEKQQAVFAPLRGELAKLHVRSGDTVSAGQLLCEFESGELEQQATRLRGEWLTIQEQLQVAIARRGDESKKSVLADRRVLEVQSRELKRQLDLIESRIAGSTIRSPQRGTVYLVRSEEVGEISEGQPVQLGQPILRVVDPDGGYSIEVEIPDRELGYVLDALDESGENTLACRYRLHAAPEAPRQGELMSVEPCASINVDGNTVVRGTIVPGSNQERFATESGLSASIHCGRGAAGFVLFRKIIEQIRML